VERQRRRHLAQHGTKVEPAGIGEARRLAIGPANATRSQLSPEEQALVRATPGHFRLSIGLEHPDDILTDLAHGLAAASAVAKTA